MFDRDDLGRVKLDAGEKFLGGSFLPKIRLKSIMDQYDFVEGAYQYYAENGYEPGNPDDGIWHDCHFPIPFCLGGTTTIKLLQEHHAIQGVLQSEEFNCPCVYGWEGKYLEGAYLREFKKWMAEKIKPARKALKVYTDACSEEYRANQSERAKGYWAQLSDEERSKLIRDRWASQSAEAKTARAVKGWKTRKKNGWKMKKPARSLAVKVIHSNGEEILYQSMTEAARELGCSRSSLHRHISGTRVIKMLSGIKVEFTC